MEQILAELPLLDDGTSPVAIRAPHLALCNLAFEGRDRGFAVSELDHSVSLHADVVEVEHRDVGFAAVDAGRRPEVVSDEEQVATTERPVISLGAPVRIRSPRARTTPGPSPVAVGAYEVAFRDFCNHAL
ncbi:MAG TPA: hypothetical protein VK486_00865 [Thermoleophilaceae bacterium]|nr:hypothetical protein [Thermoleophilaceae bacterium]